MTAGEIAIPAAEAQVTVIVVSFNTRALTLRALETLFDNTRSVTMRVVVWDNASHDGSADAIAERFPQVELIRSTENVGFAKANNAVAEAATSKWILLLNSDTETRPGAVAELIAFAEEHPEAGIVGGRTLFGDGSLNPTSCFNRMTPWSLFCLASGLTMLFPRTTLFNPEGIGGWNRDGEREVDIITGCFLLTSRELWSRLGGFSPRYFMYAEDNDLSLRAKKLGFRPMITPKAEIVHFGGASAVRREEKLVQLMQGRATIIRDHWSGIMQPVGLGLLWLWIAVRRLGSGITGLFRKHEGPHPFAGVWAKRKQWLQGYR